jgi:hypothetical protein
MAAPLLARSVHRGSGRLQRHVGCVAHPPAGRAGSDRVQRLQQRRPTAHERSMAVWASTAACAVCRLCAAAVVPVLLAGGWCVRLAGKARAALAGGCQPLPWVVAQEGPRAAQAPSARAPLENHGCQALPVCPLRRPTPGGRQLYSFCAHSSSSPSARAPQSPLHHHALRTAAFAPIAHLVVPGRPRGAQEDSAQHTHRGQGAGDGGEGGQGEGWWWWRQWWAGAEGGQRSMGRVCACAQPDTSPPTQQQQQHRVGQWLPGRLAQTLKRTSSPSPPPSRHRTKRAALARTQPAPAASPQCAARTARAIPRSPFPALPCATAALLRARTGGRGW